MSPATAKRKRSRTKRPLSRSTSATRKKTSDVRGPVYLGLGSNLGDRTKHLRDAVRAIRGFARVAAVSRFRDTEPVGYRRQPRFLNGAVKIVTSLGAHEILDRVKAIETRLGRAPSFRNGPRLIDIDLLDVRGESQRSRRLTLPHPRMQKRRFVLEPLSEIAPRWRHPTLRKTARQLLRELEG